MDKIIGCGILYGKNAVCLTDTDVLFGIFQHYDYWDNNTFELAATAFGPGAISQMPLGGGSSVYASAHIGAIPLAGNNDQFGPVSAKKRDYNYGDGAEAKLNCGLNFRGRVFAGFEGYYYWIHTYVGTAGDNFVGIIKPSISCRIFDWLSLGYEHQVYYNDRNSRFLPNVNLTRTEQRLFVSFYIEDMRYKK